MENRFAHIIQKLKSAKAENGYTNDRLSKLTGIPLGTLNKLFSGAINSIKTDTLLTLASSLELDAAQLLSENDGVADGGISTVGTKCGGKFERAEKANPTENFGFVRVGAATPEIKVADTEGNAKEICRLIDEADKKGVKVLVFPELCVCGYTCNDLFFQQPLLDGCAEAVKRITEFTAGRGVLTFIGAPLKNDGLIYNCAFALFGGRVLGVVPKSFIPNYNEFYEKRYFTSGKNLSGSVEVNGAECQFGTDLMFVNNALPECRVCAEICEDVWVADSPSVNHALNGATIIANLSASNELIGKADYRRNLLSITSAKTFSGYIYADAGAGESTQDVVFSGHNLICECGKVLAESKLFETGLIYSEIDLQAIEFDRSKQMNGMINCGYRVITYDGSAEFSGLTRKYPKYPFVPNERAELDSRAEIILRMQAEGLKKRIEHTHCKTLVIGVSGGLDSTLALLVCARALKLLGRGPADILAVTMPCFGTTARTKGNASAAAELIGATVKEIDIKRAVEVHFADIGQSPENYSVTYENSQARERTQILMDLANMTGGMVIGTGDLSELALGFATYNGDHMSMYGVNASIPKTLIRHLIAYESARTNSRLSAVLRDILDTPVSPELLPHDHGEISQKTEDIVGPYVLHDFFIYAMIRFGFGPKKIFKIASATFEGDFTRQTVYKWLKTFVRRFFAQQFKRSCLPDGVKVGSVCFSPRGDWRMPSDAVASCWNRELDEIEKELGEQNER